VVAKLGNRPVDLQGNVVVQEPTVAGVTRASVVRRPGADRHQLAHVTLDLDSSIPLNDLRGPFGDPRIVSPEHPGQPQSAVFAPVASDGTADVRLVGGVRGGVVQRIALIRDVKLSS
jgi:hypothetical protein